jgi:hypothetical protein
MRHAITASLVVAYLTALAGSWWGAATTPGLAGTVMGAVAATLSLWIGVAGPEMLVAVSRKIGARS